MKHKTRDRMRTVDERIYTTSQISPRMSMTPEGFLLCESVPIARIGELLYMEGETPIEVGRDGYAHVSRTEDDLFRPETIASFEGKSVTLDHPDEFVSPETWQELTVGVTQNVRRGVGAENDLLLADLLITDKSAIKEVQSGLREVSCGYEADYEQIEPGRGVQRNIIGNHNALVGRGRNGPRCAVRDEEPKRMKSSKTKRRTVWDSIRAAFKTGDEDALEDALNEAETADEGNDDEDEKKANTKDAEMRTLTRRVGDMEKRLTKFLDAMEEKEKTEDDDDDDKKSEETNDDGDLTEPDKAGKVSQEGVTAITGDAWRDTLSRAEILSPGMKMPTNDAAPTMKTVQQYQRRALEAAYRTEDGQAVIDPFLSGKELTRLSTNDVNGVFVGASELMRQRNNAQGARQSISTRDFGRVTTPADINRQNNDFWKSK